MEATKAEEATKEMLLFWFEDDELDVCPRCGNKHLLPPWGSPSGRVCVSCGIVSETAKIEAA